jgi:hypothetical protein
VAAFNRQVQQEFPYLGLADRRRRNKLGASATDCFAEAMATSSPSSTKSPLSEASASTTFVKRLLSKPTITATIDQRIETVESAISRLLGDEQDAGYSSEDRGESPRVDDEG